MSTKGICPQIALESVLERYGSQLLRFCVACLQDEAAGEEAMGRAFAELCRCAPKIPGSDEERLWVLTALLKACRQTGPNPSPGQKSGLEAGLCGLSLQQRQIFLMRYYLQLGEEEIAAVMHLPKALVRFRLASAQKQLEKN